jgi:hypothetical protein
MITCQPTNETVTAMKNHEPSYSAISGPASVDRLISWLPLGILPVAVFIFTARLSSWEFMWALAFALYFGCKWLTWRRAGTDAAFFWRGAAYLFGWVGLDAESFLDTKTRASKPSFMARATAVSETLFGIFLLWTIEPMLPASQVLLRGWVGLIGLVFLLHFGTFQVLALVWQYFGFKARPLMQAPMAATSLGDFWGCRWNSAFNQLAYDMVFRPLFRRIGPSLATMSVFLVSGLVHDLIISVPADAGYGLPTGYFLLQGVGMLLERSRLGKRLGLRRGVAGRCFALSITALPVFWLFHPAFINRVIVPFLQAIHSI